MRTCTVFVNSVDHHFSQLFTGLSLLEQKGTFKINYISEIGKYPTTITYLEFNHKRYCFDLADTSSFYLKLYENCDFYVKRMLLKEDAEKYPKLLPYGLYFPVYHSNSYLKWFFLNQPRLWKFSAKYWNFPFGNVRDGLGVNALEKIESKPANSKKVLFSARLWDPGKTTNLKKKNFRKRINAERVQMAERLKNRFSDDFIGGIRNDHFSAGSYPKEVMQNDEYHRKNYLLKLKCAGIGICTKGLENSVGAKFAEYQANGMAVLSPDISKFRFLGDLEEGGNFLKYDSVEDCVSKIKYFRKNPESLKKMQQDNFQYYQSFVRPEAKLLAIFRKSKNFDL